MRGLGYGLKAVNWIINYIFSILEVKIRIEAYTRIDNPAMRKVLFNCNFQKEGYLRRSWENNDGTVVDSLVYGIIREDWEQGKKTPISIDDVEF